MTKYDVSLSEYRNNVVDFNYALNELNKFVQNELEDIVDSGLIDQELIGNVEEIFFDLSTRDKNGFCIENGKLGVVLELQEYCRRLQSVALKLTSNLIQAHCNVVNGHCKMLSDGEVIWKPDDTDEAI